MSWNPFESRKKSAVSKNSRKKKPPYQPAIETLEKRWLPSTVTWNGNYDNSTWTEAGNWDVGGSRHQR
jgi:hypothetical protein